MTTGSLILVIEALIVVVWGAYFWAYYCGWLHRDYVIDKLIAANAARYLPGMERPDPEQMRRIGWVRWTHVATAQQRQYPEG